MLKFIPTTIVFCFGIIAFFVFQSTYGLSYTLLLGWCLLFSIIQFCGAYFIQLNFHVNSINKLSTVKKTVMLSFDDGPHNPNTERVLDVLKKHNVKALFCVIGKNISGNEAIMKSIVADGPHLANHSYSHAFWFDVWPTQKVIADIEQCQQLINYYQPNSKLFRPPYGVTNPNIAKALKKLNLQSVGWNVRSYDTSSNDIEKIKQRVLKQLKPNAIILLHDRLNSAPELLEQLIVAIKAEGYEFGLL